MCPAPNAVEGQDREAEGEQHVAGTARPAERGGGQPVMTAPEAADEYVNAAEGDDVAEDGDHADATATLVLMARVM